MFVSALLYLCRLSLMPLTTPFVEWSSSSSQSRVCPQVKGCSDGYRLLVSRGVSLTVHFGEGQPDGCCSIQVDRPEQKSAELNP